MMQHDAAQKTAHAARQVGNPRCRFPSKRPYVGARPERRQPVARPREHGVGAVEGNDLSLGKALQHALAQPAFSSADVDARKALVRARRYELEYRRFYLVAIRRKNATEIKKRVRIRVLPSVRIAQ